MITKITLISDVCRFGLLPRKGFEIKQKLTLNAKGQVWLTCGGYNEDLYYSSEAGRKVRKNIDPAAAGKILNGVFSYAETKEPLCVMDGGSYELYVFFDDGTKKHYDGPLFIDNDRQQNLCNEIRTVTGIDNLFLLDGGNFGSVEDFEED